MFPKIKLQGVYNQGYIFSKCILSSVDRVNYFEELLLT